MSQSNEHKSAQVEPEQPSQLNLKSMQHNDQAELKSKNKNRPAIDPKDKDQLKKKRKLLSFEDQIQQGPPLKKQKQPRIPHLNPDKTKPKHQQTKPTPKQMQQTLKTEYLQKIQKLKQQLFQIDFSYWDGHLVVKKLKRKKKQSIKTLIQVCRLELIANFQSLASCRSQDLLMVIKDFIIPHKMTIADIQALELKTAKGDLLLNFKNVKIKDMVLSVNCDAPVRIIEKAKYEKNIAAHPFNTWRIMEID